MKKDKEIENSKGNLAASLYQSGERVFSRSSKLHRARGLLCGIGYCPNCMMRVNGVPNLRVCKYTKTGVSYVQKQNHFAMLDSFNLLSHFHKFIQVGFQYERLYKGKRRKQLFYSLLKRASGLGIAASSFSNSMPRVTTLKPDLLVIGGGIAGIAAALEGSKRYDSVLLVDSQAELGGEFYQRWHGSEANGAADDTIREKLDSLARYSSTLQAMSAAKILLATDVVGFYRLERLVLARSEDTLYKIAPDNVVLATGGHEVLPMFPGNDTPRIILSLGAQILLNSGVKLGNKAIVVDLNGSGTLVATHINYSGTEVECVTKPSAFSQYDKALSDRYGIPLIEKSILRNVKENGEVQLEESSGIPKKMKLNVDSVVICGRYQPNYELAKQMGCALRFTLNGETVSKAVESPVKQDAPPLSVKPTGALTGKASFEDCLQDGVASVSATNTPTTPSEDNVSSYGNYDEITIELDPDEYLVRAVSEHSLDSFVCLCEDVTLEEILRSIKRGYYNIESIKRYTGAVTGPCQGKQCAQTVASVIALKSSEEQNLGDRPYFTTTRQPIFPLALRELAGEEKEDI